MSLSLTPLFVCRTKKLTHASIDCFEHNGEIIMIQLNKFFDRGQIIMGKMPWDGGEMITSPLCIIYPADRAEFYEAFGVEEVPVAMQLQYAMHYGFALDPNDEVRGLQAELLKETVDQLVNLIDGTADEANSATFKITVRHHAATAAISTACQALLIGREKREKKFNKK